MGDSESIDGSSTAAQGAQDTSGKVIRFWHRLFNRNSGKNNKADSYKEYSGHLHSGGGLSKLRDLRVEDVAVPKTDIVAVPVNIAKDDLIEVFRSSGMTRLPVYDGTLDTPLGLVNLKDVALKYGFNGNGQDFDLASGLRQILYVPPSMRLGVLLQKMQAERIHMALVIDEYGGTDGLLTIEDLVEQVVGEIEDEHDLEEDENVVREKPGVYLALSKTPLEEFEELIGQKLTDLDDFDTEEIDTLGGLVFILAGHVPARGEVIVHPDGPEFEVIDADPRRIKRLRVRVSKDSRAETSANNPSADSSAA